MDIAKYKNELFATSATMQDAVAYIERLATASAEPSIVYTASQIAMNTLVAELEQAARGYDPYLELSDVMFSNPLYINADHIQSMMTRNTGKKDQFTLIHLTSGSTWDVRETPAAIAKMVSMRRALK